MSKSPMWRDFERLVALIETEAAPRGAVVKSPDRLRDLITGRLREVDASIQFRAGTVPILVTIECRRRTRKGDDVWIEQLATKRQRLGAAKTIAVSSSGFSKSARLSARQYGIELRELSRVKPEDVEGWFLPQGVVHLFRLVEELQCKVLRRGAERLEPVDPMLPLFRHDLVHAPFPAATFLNFIELRDPKRFWAVPLDGTKTRLSFELNATSPDLIPVPLGIAKPDSGSLRIIVENGETEIARLELSVVISYEAILLDRQAGQHHMYSTPQGEAIQHSAFEGEVFGLPVRFDHQADSKGNVSSSVQWPSGLRLPSPVWTAEHHNKQTTKNTGSEVTRAYESVAIRRNGAILASLVLSFDRKGKELSWHHEVGIGLAIKHIGSIKGHPNEFAFRIDYSRKVASPLFKYPKLATFLKSCEFGDSLMFGTAEESDVPLDNFTNLRSVGRMVRKIEAIYVELGVTEPAVTVAQIMDGTFADSYALLNNIVESKNSDLENPLPGVDPVPSHKSYEWQGATLFCPLVVPLPEGLMIVTADFNGEVALEKPGSELGFVGWRFFKATGLHLSPDSLQGLQITRPLIVFNSRQAYELHDMQLRVVRPPLEKLSLQARLWSD